MDNHRSGMLLLIIINMMTRFSTYGTLHEAFCVVNATDQCHRNFSIQCLNETLNFEKVYYLETACEAKTNGNFNWCYNIITPNDTHNETLSSMFADMCNNTSLCNLSSIKGMSKGRYLMVYSCGNSDTNVSRGNAAAIAIIGVAIVIVVSVGTTVIFIRRRNALIGKVTSMNGAGHDNPVYSPDLLIDNHHDVEGRSATCPEDQDHDYDHVQSRGKVETRPNANYDKVIHGMIGSKPECSKAKKHEENENNEWSDQESQTSEYDRIVLSSTGVAGARVQDCSAYMYGHCASVPQELKEKDNELPVKQIIPGDIDTYNPYDDIGFDADPMKDSYHADDSVTNLQTMKFESENTYTYISSLTGPYTLSSEAPELGTTMASETEEEENENVQDADNDVEYSQPVKRQQQTN